MFDLSNPNLDPTRLKFEFLDTHFRFNGSSHIDWHHIYVWLVKFEPDYKTQNWVIDNSKPRTLKIAQLAKDLFDIWDMENYRDCVRFDV